MKLNAQNERIKYRCRSYLKDAKQLDEKTVDEIAAALDRFEEHTRHRDFRTFRAEQASTFKSFLLKETNKRTGKPLSKATVVTVLQALKAFFFWLAGQPGYKSHLQYDSTEYFNPSRKDLEIARARRQKPVPTLGQIHAAIAAAPSETVIEKRNRALLAFAILSGGRDDAIASMKIKHIDLVDRVVHFDGRDVRTKFSKTYDAWFFPVGGDAEAIVREWVQVLRVDLGFGVENPLFPATKVGFDAQGSPLAPSLTREGWSNAEPIRRIFREVFEGAGMQYFNPHSFRSTLARLGTVRCRGPEALKSWSQNLGHDQVLTTLTSYGSVPPHRQRELILGADKAGVDTEAALEIGLAVLRSQRKNGTAG